MDEVIVAGAGPAGAWAAARLARAGVRVRLLDRARFPRPKLCGDTLNPGALRLLGEHVALDRLLSGSIGLDGMLLTGPGGAAVRGRYPDGVQGRALPRATFDSRLVDHAVEAGAQFDDGVAVVSARSAGGGKAMTRVTVRTTAGAVHDIACRLVIAADGRGSRLARACGLARHPVWPRRWAIGGYFEGVEDLSRAGEMHVRRGHYIGVAPMPGGLANACLVVPHHAGAARLADPARALTGTLAGDALLAPRFAAARLVGPVQVLGPMAVDADAAGVPGVLLAGDAAGFIDPMTGDGLRFALAGAGLAASVALDVLAGGVEYDLAAARLTAARRRAFQAKWRFNRALRALVSSPAAVSAAALGARLLPSAFADIIRYAGDCGAGGGGTPLGPAVSCLPRS